MQLPADYSLSSRARACPRTSSALRSLQISRSSSSEITQIQYLPDCHINYQRILLNQHTFPQRVRKEC